MMTEKLPGKLSLIYFVHVNQIKASKKNVDGDDTNRTDDTIIRKVNLL